MTNSEIKEGYKVRTPPARRLRLIVRHEIVARILFIGLVSSLSASTAWSCSCADVPPIPAAVSQAATVFTGRVIELKVEIREEDGQSVRFVRCVLDQVKGFKGLEPSVETVSIITEASGSRCGYPFRIEERFLVYGFLYNGELRTSVCQRTKPLSSFVREPFNDLVPRFAGEEVDDSGQREADLVAELTRRKRWEADAVGSRKESVFWVFRCLLCSKQSKVDNILLRWSHSREPS